MSDLNNYEVDKFIDIAIRSKLLDRSELEAVRTACIASANSAAITVDNLCESLVTRELLTVWQCEKLRKGQYKGFFFEQRYKLLSYLGSDNESSRYLAFDLKREKTIAVRIYPREPPGKHRYFVEQA